MATSSDLSGPHVLWELKHPSNVHFEAQMKQSQLTWQWYRDDQVLQANVRYASPQPNKNSLSGVSRRRTSAKTRADGVKNIAGSSRILQSKELSYDTAERLACRGDELRMHSPIKWHSGRRHQQSRRSLC